MSFVGKSALGKRPRMESTGKHHHSLNHLSCLPDEHLREIFLMIPLSESVELRLVCKRFNEILDHHYVWQQRALQYYKEFRFYFALAGFELPPPPKITERATNPSAEIDINNNNNVATATTAEDSAPFKAYMKRYIDLFKSISNKSCDFRQGLTWALKLTKDHGYRKASATPALVGPSCLPTDNKNSTKCTCHYYHSNFFSHMAHSMMYHLTHDRVHVHEMRAFVHQRAVLHWMIWTVKKDILNGARDDNIKKQIIQPFVTEFFDALKAKKDKFNNCVKDNNKSIPKPRYFDEEWNLADEAYIAFAHAMERTLAYHGVEYIGLERVRDVIDAECRALKRQQ
eukprot:GEZU01021665.1.p1 GENE.GEZU01021665.1~~GEZU01021665.1.p1  ORF type:complete len:341 (+),score=78.71 GEZU01021665.1:77-1099(+)